MSLATTAWIRYHLPLFWAVGLPLYLVLLWLLLAAISSVMSGWRGLARFYRFPGGRFSGATWRWQSGALRYWTRYGNVLVVGASPEGLYLSTVFLFRAFHPPLLIPWNEIKVHLQKPMFGKLVSFNLGWQLQIPLRVREDLGKKIRAAAGPAFPAETIA